MQTVLDKVEVGSIGWIVGLVMGIVIIHYWPKIRIWIAEKISKS